jgi:hypothetical protein
VVLSTLYRFGSRCRLEWAQRPRREIGSTATASSTRLWRTSCYGLVLVDELAADWGIDAQADSTTVWFEAPAA